MQSPKLVLNPFPLNHFSIKNCASLNCIYLLRWKTCGICPLLFLRREKEGKASLLGKPSWAREQVKRRQNLTFGWTVGFNHDEFFSQAMWFWRGMLNLISDCFLCESLLVFSILLLSLLPFPFQKCPESPPPTIGITRSFPRAAFSHLMIHVSLPPLFLSYTSQLFFSPRENRLFPHKFLMGCRDFPHSRLSWGFTNILHPCSCGIPIVPTSKW